MVSPRDPEDRSRKLQRKFLEASPTAYRRAPGNVAAVKALATIEKRAEMVKQRAVRHCKAFENLWTAKEILRLCQHQLAQHLKNPPPPGVTPDISPKGIHKLAAHNVKARINRRLSHINAIKTRMSNAVARNLEKPSLTQSFQQSAPETAQRAPSKKLRNKR